MSRSADVTSFEALRRFAEQLAEYGRILEDALAALGVKTEKIVEWFDAQQPQYWTAEVARAREGLTEALDRLHQKELATRPEDRPPCYEERQAVERARRRLRYVESRLIHTRDWGPRVRVQAEALRTVVARLRDLAGREIPQARMALERRLQALERYAHRQMPSPRSGPCDGNEGT